MPFALRPSPFAIVAIGVAFEAGLGAAALGAGWILGVHPLATFAWDHAAAGKGALCAVVLFLGLMAAFEWRIGPMARLKRLFLRVLAPLFEHCSVVHLALISLAAGWGEELMFRGLVQAGLERVLPPAAALVLASFAFGLAHSISATYALLASLIGMVLGWLWLATGNLLAPITAHAAYDFLALVWLVRRRGQ